MPPLSIDTREKSWIINKALNVSGLQTHTSSPLLAALVRAELLQLSWRENTAAAFPVNLLILLIRSAASPNRSQRCVNVDTSGLMWKLRARRQTKKWKNLVLNEAVAGGTDHINIILEISDVRHHRFSVGYQVNSTVRLTKPYCVKRRETKQGYFKRCEMTLKNRRLCLVLKLERILRGKKKPTDKYSQTNNERCADQHLLIRNTSP